MHMGYGYAERMDAAGRLDPHFGIATRREFHPEPAAAAA